MGLWRTAPRELNGVRVGQRVRDLDGRPLGRVVAVYASEFAVRRGLWLFRRDAVVRYEEVRSVRDGELVVARSERDLFVLAAGGIPPSWRIPTPAGYPDAATPGEATALRAEIARGAIEGSVPMAEAPRPARVPLDDVALRELALHGRFRPAASRTRSAQPGR